MNHPFNQKIIVDIHGGGIPEPVKQELRRLRSDHELGNNSWYKWFPGEMVDDYPVIEAWLVEALPEYASMQYPDFILFLLWW